MKNIKTIGLGIFWLAVCQLPALVSAPAVKHNMAWFNTLTRPVLVPPDAVFGLAWGVLYILLGLAAAIALRPSVQKPKRTAIILLLLQLVLNAMWTPVFFGLQNLAGALIIILMMIAEGTLLHRAFYRLDKRASYLLWPYWGWLLFATYLTAGYVRLNF